MLTTRRTILKNWGALLGSLHLSTGAAGTASGAKSGHPAGSGGPPGPAGSGGPAGPARALSRRPIPASGESLPVIGLGTWQTFDVGSDAAARAPLRQVLAAFFAGGGRLLDSSPMYGRSEAVVGELAAELKLEAPFLATKVWTRGREAGIQQMEQSFSRLRARRLELLQVHNLVDVETHTKTLQAWKAEGRVRYIGITHYAASAHAEVERWLKTGAYDFLQINYSLAEREAEQRLLPLAAEQRVAVLINRPFAEGALFARVKGKPLPDWAQELGVQSFAQLFLKWILGHSAVTCVIPATAKPAHVQDNLLAGSGAFPEAAQRRRIAQWFERL